MAVGQRGGACIHLSNEGSPPVRQKEMLPWGPRMSKEGESGRLKAEEVCDLFATLVSSYNEMTDEMCVCVCVYLCLFGLTPQN